MSSRALRRITQTRHQEPETNASSDECPTFTPPKGAFSKFDFSPLFTSDCFHIPEDAEESYVSTAKVRRKKNAKRKKELQKIKDRVVMSCADTDEFPEVDLPSSGVSHNTSVYDLLVVNSRSLDPESELRRLFGTHVFRDIAKSERPRQSRLAKRGPLVRVKMSWPPVIRFGLDMVEMPNGLHTFVHSKEYRKTQMSFYNALDTTDPDNLVNILADCPYHVDCLLQLSDILIRQEDMEMGTDLLERVLHAYQSVFHPAFNPTIGTCRLDYLHQENRGLFVALFRYICAIGSRGCYRTALDYCKVLLSLDVDEDPLAVLLVIDHYALLSKQLDFLLQLYNRLDPSKNLHLLPNFAFSISLALKWMEKTESSADTDPDTRLQDALIMFPGFLTRLLKHVTIGGVSNLDRSVLFGKEAQNEPASLGRLLDLYVARSRLLWTAPETLPWLESNVANVLNLTESKATDATPVDARLADYSRQRQVSFTDLPRNILRHLVLADIAEAPPLLPRGNPTDTLYSFDPFPPVNSIDICSSHDDRHRLAAMNSGGGLLSSFFSSMLPGYSSARPRLHDHTSLDSGEDPTSSMSAVGRAFTTAAEHVITEIRRVLDLQTPPSDRAT